MSVTALIASPVLKAGMNLLLPEIHKLLGGGRAADKLLSQIQLKALEIDGSRIAAQQKILEAEIGANGSWLTKNWRPIAMFVFLFLLIWQMVLVPLINAMFGSDTIVLDAQLTYEIIGVIKWAMGGYIVGRSMEKTAEAAVIAGREKSPPTIETIPDDGMKPRRVRKDVPISTPPFMRRD